MEEIERMGERIIGMGEKEYKKKIKNWEEKKKMVIIKGDKGVFRKKNVEIVG